MVETIHPVVYPRSKGLLGENCCVLKRKPYEISQVSGILLMLMLILLMLFRLFATL